MAKAKKGQSLGRDAWRRLRRNKASMAGLFIVVIMSFTAIFADLIIPFEPDYGQPWIRSQPPGYEHPAVLAENRFTVGEALHQGTILLQRPDIFLRHDPAVGQYDRSVVTGAFHQNFFPGRFQPGPAAGRNDQRLQTVRVNCESQDRSGLGEFNNDGAVFDDPDLPWT